MTTIAYKDGIIAYDGRVTAGRTIVYDDFDKLRERDGAFFLGTGATSEINKLIGLFFGEEIIGECGAEAIVAQDGVLTLIGYYEGKLSKTPMLLDRPYAIGSGMDHALTAFDMGASAYQAVEMAMKRDSCTGGKIRTLTVTKPIE
ncbi:proteasome subunit beta [Pseudomonas sp. G11]|uniref:proteasome subunit beta n=1 Tax=Pseudomonas sp. G11 TaxID=528343 RepID=UPI002402B897|nr:proteasome subunit beta [Pseudomonas sp. G11]WEX18958.1 proteasome subunit beta [Pseudomonas sp. G11]